jgi:S-formylglutathione hydrolase
LFLLRMVLKCSSSTGAGFYLDATQEKWKQYRMYSYITTEVMGLLQRDTAQLDCSRMSICGHSMGGHGALTIGLKNPAMFKSISAFSPICHPSECPWGIKGASVCMELCEWNSVAS